MAFTDSGAPGTWKRWFHDYPPDIARRFWGVRMFTGTLGALFDRYAQGILDGVVGSYYKGGDLPAYDAPRHIGNEVSMPQYATETWVQYVNRLSTDWDTWETAGSNDCIVNQLELAGAPGAQLFRFSESGSWSEFVVFYPAGSHPVTGENEYGSGLVYGDGSTYGPVGITPEELSTYKDLIKHWKPAEWKCPYLVWEISGATYGTGHTYGESGLTYGGGAQVRTKVQ